VKAFRERFFSAERATHAVYGSIIVLAVVTGLDEASARARTALLAIVGAALAVVLGEVYADMIGTTLRQRHVPTRRQWWKVLIDVSFGFGAALAPEFFFLLAYVGWISLDHAFTIAEWGGLAVLAVYVLAAARAAGLGVMRSACWAVVLTLCGVGLVELKSLAHH